MTRTITILAAALAAVAACGNRPATREAPAATVAPAAAPAPAPATPTTPLDDTPIYELDLAVQTQDGARVALADFEGHPVLVTMFYASCPAACPVLIEELRAIDQAISAERRADLRVVLVSFDPARDTPAQLAALARARNLDTSRWTLAAADQGDARLLAAVLGIKYRALDNGEFSHSSVITALDREGRPLARLEGFGADRTPIIAAIEGMR